MNGLTKLFPEGGSAAAGRAAVEAVKAGNDMLLIPSDLDGSYNGLLQAVRSGEIPESRIDESVLKILRAKASVGLNKAKLVDISAVNEIVAKPASLATAQQIADSAVTLVRDNHQVLPLKATREGTNAPQNAYQPAAETHNRTLVLIFTDDSRSDWGRLLDQQVRMRIPDAHVMYIDPRDAAGLKQPVMDAVQQARGGDRCGLCGSQRREARPIRRRCRMHRRRCCMRCCGPRPARLSLQRWAIPTSRRNFPRFKPICAHSPTLRFLSSVR